MLPQKPEQQRTDIWATSYVPNAHAPVPSGQRAEWVRKCLDKVKGGEACFYERQGDTLIVACRMPNGRIHWFDTVMQAWGGEQTV